MTCAGLLRREAGIPGPKAPAESVASKGVKHEGAEVALAEAKADKQAKDATAAGSRGFALGTWCDLEFRLLAGRAARLCTGNSVREIETRLVTCATAYLLALANLGSIADLTSPGFAVVPVAALPPITGAGIWRCHCRSKGESAHQRYYC